MDIMLIGKGRSPTLDANRLHDTISIHSYASIISSAKTKMDWLIASLATSSTVFQGLNCMPNRAACRAPLTSGMMLESTSN